MTRYVSTRAAMAAYIAEAKRIAALVVDRRAYIDTVVIRSNRPFPANLVSFVQNGCGGLAWPKDENVNPYWRYRFTMHRPSDTVFACLGRYRGGPIKISRVDLSLDYITATPRDARIVQRFFDTHAVKRWHGKQRLGRYDGSTYTARTDDRPANLFAGYSDMPSKTSATGGRAHCYHHEWRCQTPDAVRRAGVHTCRDLINFAHRAYWAKNLLLQAIDYGRLGWELEMRDRRKRGATIARRRDYERYAPAGHAFASRVREVDDAGQFTRPDGCVQELKDNCEDLDTATLRKCLITIPNAPFLP